MAGASGQHTAAYGHAAAPDSTAVIVALTPRGDTESRADDRSSRDRGNPLRQALRVKLVKCQMFGHAKLDLLWRRVLLVG
jgi:hypothetical protein